MRSITYLWNLTLTSQLCNQIILTRFNEKINTYTIYVAFSNKLENQFPKSYQLLRLKLLKLWFGSFISIVLTCFSSSSELALRQVTRCLVSCKNPLRISEVRWSREHLCSMKEMTRKPRHWIMCCWTVWDDSTKEQMKPRSLELWNK